MLPVLEATGVLSDEQLESWNNYRLSELSKTIAVDNERRLICEELDKNGIKYMFLKGLINRTYYPKTSMRQMSDNDILYCDKDRDKLCSIMKHRGYYIGASGGISDDFYKKPYCTFEFHRTLFNPEEPFCPDFNPWEHAVPFSEASSQMVMSKEDNFLYTTGHMYKHYYCIDGCGVRFICDLYLLTHSGDKLDWDYINSRLEEFGIRKFSNTVQKLGEAIFEDGSTDEETNALLDFLFEGGVFGSSSYSLDNEIEKYGSKGKFLIHRIFPSVKEMKAEYRVLDKKPYLLGYYYIYRLIDKYRHNRKYMKRDLDALKNKE